MVTTFPWLTVLWAIPMVGAALVMLLPAAQRTVAKWLALLISIAVLGVTLVVAVGFKPGGDQYQFVESHPWIPSFGTGYITRILGIESLLPVGQGNPLMLVDRIREVESVWFAILTPDLTATVR